ncbi:MAG: hypothetical protein FJX70_06385 [Alphaproteobacteria bacterium]|nr:hypothetical protein [Alphaproteobacteria bacterium]
MDHLLGGRVGQYNWRSTLGNLIGDVLWLLEIEMIKIMVWTSPMYRIYNKCYRSRVENEF